MTTVPNETQPCPYCGMKDGRHYDAGLRDHCPQLDSAQSEGSVRMEQPRETVVFYRDTPYEVRVTGVRDVAADPPFPAWGEEVRYLTDDRDQRDRMELVIMQGGNSDWYVSTVPEGDAALHGVRLCTSGGASSKAPGLTNAIAQAYRAMRGEVSNDQPRTEASEPESTRVCWQCLNDQANPAHDPNAHGACPSWCTHHSYEYEPTSRIGLLNHVGALLSAISSREAELRRLAGPECPHCPKRAIEHVICDEGTVECRKFGIHTGWCSESHPAWPAGEKWLREHAR